MKTLFLWIALLFITIAQSQSMPSPSASQMTRYGNVSINESSGRVTTSIPLYNYQAGNLSLPIGLSYVGNGVKVDQQSSWVGTNWNLNAGGVVTRVVNHIADEVASTRLNTSTLVTNIEDPNYFSYFNDVLFGANLTDDLRPDIFSFAFPGYSGSFYLNDAMQPTLMVDNTELKIALVTSPTDSTLLNTIEIITPDGVKYYFGGDFATESSSSLVNRTTGPFGADSVDFTVIPKSITAFYLYKIEHPFGDEINIEYMDYGDQELTISEGDELRGVLKHEYYELGEPTGSSICNVDENLKISRYKQFGKIYNRKKIQKISSLNSNYEVNFNSSALYLDPVGTFNDPQYDDRVLNAITVRDTFIDEIIKNIQLNYLNTPYRFFLETVTTNNETDPSSLNKCKVYTLTYDEPEILPERFSEEQDLLGYYNERVPKKEVLSIEDYLNNLGNATDETTYLYNLSRKGALKKVTYPSGGHTLFEYETPKVTALQNIDAESIYGARFSTQNILIEDLEYSELVIGEEINFPNPIFGVDIDQSITVSVDIDFYTLDAVGSILPTDGVYVQLVNNETGTLQTQPVLFEDHTSDFSKNVNFLLEKGYTYTMSFAYAFPDFDVSKMDFRATAKTKYQYYDDFNAYGIRVSKVSDYPNNDSNDPLIKKYYYKRASQVYLNETDYESAIVTYEPPKEQRDYILNPCCPSVFGYTTYSYTSLISDPFTTFFAGTDNQVSYKYVTISLGGENFEEGGIEKQFRVETQNPPEVIYSPQFAPTTLGDPDQASRSFFGNYTDNNMLLNGSLLKETQLQNDNDTLKILKETSYLYDIDTISQTKGVILTNHTEECASVLDFSSYTGHYQASIAEYNNNSYKFNLTQVLVTDHTGDLLSVTNPTSGSSNTLVSTQAIEYGQLKGMPTKVTSKNSDNEFQITKHYYLTDADIDDMNLQENLSVDEIQSYQSLIAQHRIGAPIQTESYFKKDSSIDQLRARQRILYADFGGLTLQKEVQTSKLNSPLETRSTYHQYDDKGYVLEMSSDNNVKTVVIYGYKDRKVIAQLVNINYDDIPAATIANLKALSENIVDTTTMLNFATSLDQLRSDFPDAQVSTYVYNRLGQLTRMRDTRGYLMSYEYDECYRLRQVKDHLGNILQEHEYNIINNNN